MPCLHTVRTYGFRNLADDSWDLSGKEIFFTGKNGQGKTNFLESIYLLCSGSSFRTRHIEQLCQHGRTQTGVNGLFADDQISVQIVGKTRTILQNDKKIRSRQELFLQFPCIAFVHEDISFITGAPSVRRRYLDQCLSIAEPTYLSVLQNYRKILQKKNAALKSENYSVLQTLNFQLVQYGLQIRQWREAFIRKFSPLMAERYTALSGTSTHIKMEYSPSWKQDKEDAIMDHLSQQQSVETLVKNSLSGPHRDNILMFCDEVPVENVASMGQLRAISLIYRIIQAEMLNSQHQQPILLFDDVLLELDAEKKENFNAIIPSFSQAFFTFLGYEHFEVLQSHDAKVYTVDKGRLIE